MHPQVGSQVRWILGWQSMLALAAAAVSGLVGGRAAAVSAVVGGGIGVLAGAAYVWRALRHSEGEAGKLYRAQVLGEGYKFAVTIALFMLVFLAWRDVPALPLFLAYILTFGVYWVALLKKR